MHYNPRIMLNMFCMAIYAYRIGVEVRCVGLGMSIIVTLFAFLSSSPFNFLV